MIPSHKLDIYDDVTVHLATTVKRYRRLCKRIGDLDGAAVWHSVGQVQTFHTGDGSDGERPTFDVVICLDRRVVLADPVTLAQYAAHEATHAAGLIHDHMGQTYDGTSESLAYLVGWLTRWTLENLK